MTDLELVRKLEDIMKTYVFKNEKGVLMYNKAFVEHKIKDVYDQYLAEKEEDKETYLDILTDILKENE